MGYLEIDALVARLQQGEREAWGRLAERFAPKLYRLAAALPLKEDREDCLQDLRIALYEGVMKYDRHLGCTFNAFISRYLELEFKKWQSGRYRRYNGGRPKAGTVALSTPVDGTDNLTYAEVLQDEEADCAAEGIAATERRQVREWVFGQDSRLTPREQELFRAHFWQDKSLARIAQERQIRRQSVASYLERALDKLRKDLPENLKIT